jgi:cytochrome P450
VQDPYPFYERARAAGPLFVWEDFGFPCAAGYDAVNAVLRDRRFGREPPGGPPPRPAHLADFYAIDDNAMLDREPPAHTRLRGLVLRAFTSRRIAALRPEIEQLAEDLIDAFDGEEVDLLPAFAQKLPVIVIARLLGVPEAMSDQLLAWSNAMVAMYQARRDRTIEDGANRAAAEFAAFLRGYIAERRRAPRDDLLSALIAAESRGRPPQRAGAGRDLRPSAQRRPRSHSPHDRKRCRRHPPRLGVDPQRLFAGRSRHHRDGRGDPAVRSAAPPLHPICARGRGGLRPPLRARRDRRPAARRREPRSATLSRTGPLRPGPRWRGSASLLRRGLHFCVGAPLARLELVAALPILFRRLPGLSLAVPPAYADRYHFHGRESLRIRNDSAT